MQWTKYPQKIYKKGAASMFILFEKEHFDDDTSIFDYDIMGAVSTEEKAIDWRNRNIDCRTYKYMCDNYIPHDNCEEE